MNKSEQLNEQIRTAYVNFWKNCVMVRHNQLQMWEVDFVTVKGAVNKGIAPAISYEEHKADAITDMRKKGNPVPASRWQRVKYKPQTFGSWNAMVEGIWANAKKNQTTTIQP